MANYAPQEVEEHDREHKLDHAPHNEKTTYCLFMNLSKQHLLTNTFFKIQFNYCPLILMWHSQKKEQYKNKRTAS